LFDGDHEKVRELERKVSASIGFSTAIPVSGQTYTRKIDAQVLDVVAGIAASAAKFSGDIRVLQSFGEIEEPFESSQVGSSAMAYKRNPMRCERIASLARFVLNLEGNANETHAVQFLERTLDDSANRRLTIPESFLATDAILVLMENVVSGLEVHPARIRRRLQDELPFMATEQLLMRAVREGGDRQAAHEQLRKHSIEAARALKEGAPCNDLLDRLVADPAWKVSMREMNKVLDPATFVGRAPQQVDEFLREVVEPLLEGSEAVEAEEVRV
jgi:adenylosuccinate lyase